MLKRCYCEKDLEKYPTYRGCTVCDEWLLFSNFKRWMEKQDWEGRQLDKDLLVEGNKVYSPATCIFVPNKLNTFIIIRSNYRGEYPLGVYFRKKLTKKPKSKNNYRSQISGLSGKLIHIGMYPTPQEAHRAYLAMKLEQCNSYIDEFKNEEPIIKGLTRVKNKIEYHIENNLELTSF